ncbi:hypothetical protein K3179_06925 [Qipengyuania sp. GH38]|uniref:hypothetical protein n=1 Tax=Qipengyuania intermedia TaxID=2867244 RepID=UPI001C877EB6|nr:hypothetical protein [Qipengyuania intermedia]MBX7514283.1 hypothetical protein [Qipengyuania intermedia]
MAFLRAGLLLLAAASTMPLASGCSPLSAQSATYGLPAPEVTQLDHAPPQTILFIGNSYFYYNDSLHNHVQRMVAASGVLGEAEPSYKSATIGGAALRDHAVEHLVDHTKLSVDRPFELVILQGISSAALTEESRARFNEAATRHADTIRSAGAEPVLYMTPAYAPEHRRYSPDMTAQTARLYIDTANRLDAMVIPVGLAFEEALRRRPDIVLHKPFDSSHPSMLGTYLAAATVFATLYGQSPVGNPYDYFGAVSAEDALFLQQVAQDTVSSFFGRTANDQD